MRTTALAVGILLLATAVGCAGNRQHQASADAEGGYTAPASIYSVMDPTSLVYTDVAAGASPSDNPWRWTGFLLHPLGVAHGLRHKQTDLHTHQQDAVPVRVHDRGFDAG